MLSPLPLGIRTPDQLWAVKLVPIALLAAQILGDTGAGEVNITLKGDNFLEDRLKPHGARRGVRISHPRPRKASGAPGLMARRGKNITERGGLGS